MRSARCRDDAAATFYDDAETPQLYPVKSKISQHQDKTAAPSNEAPFLSNSKIARFLRPYITKLESQINCVRYGITVLQVHTEKLIL